MNSYNIGIGREIVKLCRKIFDVSQANKSTGICFLKMVSKLFLIFGTWNSDTNNSSYVEVFWTFFISLNYRKFKLNSNLSNSYQ